MYLVTDRVAFDGIKGEELKQLKTTSETMSAADDVT
jgi:hypothetical protein